MPFFGNRKLAPGEVMRLNADLFPTRMCDCMTAVSIIADKESRLFAIIAEFIILGTNAGGGI